MALKQAGFDCEAEFSTPVGRLDIIVWRERDKSVICGIEVKKDEHGYSEYGVQRRKYSRLPMKMLVCRGMEGIEGTVKEVGKMGDTIKVELMLSVERWKRSKKRLSRSEKIARYVSELDEDVNYRNQ